MVSLGERELSAAVVTPVADNSAGFGEIAEPSSDVDTGGGIETLLASVGEAEQ